MPRVQGVIGAGSWAAQYSALYGSVPDFLRTHPEAFYQRKADGAFYRPNAPARLPPQVPAAATAAITPAAPHARATAAAPASGVGLCQLHVLHARAALPV
jgi:hypothetical protein